LGILDSPSLINQRVAYGSDFTHSFFFLQENFPRVNCLIINDYGQKA
jgi:hypothetical protein